MRLALSLVIALSLALAAPAAAAKPKCSLPSKAKVLASSGYAVAYSVGDARYRACIRRTGEKLLLHENSFDDDPDFHNVTIVGRYVGWVEILHDRWQQTHGSVHVYDLKRAKLRWRGEGPYLPTGELEVTDFALAPTGRVAYVTRQSVDPSGRQSQWRTVWVRDAGGSRSRL